jgi:predicted RNA-binding protein YlxR (DUF448 family)
MTDKKQEGSRQQQTQTHQTRQCIVCRLVKPKPDLIRIANDITSQPSIDWNRTSQSRGCYVCNAVTCMNKLAKAPTMVERHLKTKLNHLAASRLKEQIESILEGTR